jgi:hypothetical protein
MTEKSYPWGGTTVGDAIYAKYSDDVWGTIWRKLFTTDRNTEGVISEILNTLQVTGVASPVSVNTGCALVDGKFYRNDAAVNVAIANPMAATRIDSIVLRKDWAAKTVRIVLISGAEGGVAPALVHTDGVTWDTPLAEVSITTLGVITVADTRSYLPGGSLRNPSLCNGRLTLATFTPVTTADVTGATTLYFTPYKGNLIALYDGLKWFVKELTEVSLDIAGFVANTLYDIFIYNNGGVLTLEQVAWNAPATAAVTSISNASPRVVTVTASTAGLITGDFVTIAGNSVPGNNNTWRAGTIVANTSIVLLNLDGTNSAAPGGVGNGGTWQQKYDIAMARPAPLVMIDGVYTRSGAPTKRYLGTILINSFGGQTDDAVANRFVWNYYNRVRVSAYKTVEGLSWTSTGAPWQCFGNDYQYAIPFIVGVNDSETFFTTKMSHYGANADTFSMMDIQLDLLGALSNILNCEWVLTTTGVDRGVRQMMYPVAVEAGVHVAFPSVGLSGANSKLYTSLYSAVMEDM